MPFDRNVILIREIGVLRKGLTPFTPGSVYLAVISLHKISTLHLQRKIVKTGTITLLYRACFLYFHSAFSSKTVSVNNEDIFLPWTSMNDYSKVLYSSSVTGSNHSAGPAWLLVSTERCTSQMSLAAPCQCFTFAGIFTTSPALISRADYTIT